VKKSEAAQIVAAAKSRGLSVQYLLAPDEGHGFVRPVNTLALYLAVERFLAAHLGGRMQDQASPEIVKRLGEITVAPENVALTH
jgi:hypothetical protein